VWGGCALRVRVARSVHWQRGGAWRLPAAAAASAWDTARVSFIDLEFWSWSCTLNIAHFAFAFAFAST
jgi:hypothetical protein